MTPTSVCVPYSRLFHTEVPMSASKYAGHVTNVPQSEPLPGQVKNSAGGHSWALDCWGRLDRFLILGSEGGTYYVDERKLTKENAQSIEQCFLVDPIRTVDRIVEVSERGLAPKNDPAIFALAMLSRDPYAMKVMPRVCRIGTHLFQYIQAARQFRGMGTGFRKAIWAWYANKTDEQIAYQVTKYAQRDGMSHRDVIRLVRPKNLNTRLMRWMLGLLEDDREVCRKNQGMVAVPYDEATGNLPTLCMAVALVKVEPLKIVCELIESHRLAREVLPTQLLNEPEIWESLLKNMPMTAMIRNLGKMGNVGLLKPLSAACQQVVAQLGNLEALKKARIHPIQVLMAHSIYKHGKGLKGSLSWTPDSSVIDALDGAFYKAFEAVEPTGKRFLLALDVSGSMGAGSVGGSFLTPREASAAMALVTIKTEPFTHTVGFTAGGGRAGYYGATAVTPLPFGKTETLTGAVKKVSSLSFGATDCALPMLYALQNKLEVDVFVIYTDNETWAGNVHPAKALQEYRKKMGIDAKLIVVGMTSNGFSIADPKDPGMLDVVGFSADVPAVMRQFIAQ